MIAIRKIRLTSIFTTTIILLLYQTTSFAKLVAWDEDKSKELITQYPLKIKNGFVSSLWGTINEPSVSLKTGSILEKPVAKMINWKGKSDYFKTGFLKGKFLYWKKSENNKARPLYIIIPGSFSNLSTPQTKRYAHTLFKKGYNVIMLPNPLSIDYLSNNPKFMLGNIFKESESIIEAVENWLNSSEAKLIKISSINIVGTSYGGFVASIITGSKSKWKSLHKKTFIISAPRYLSKSMELLEGHIIKGLKNVSSYKLVEFYKMISKAAMIYIGGPNKNFLDKNVLSEVQSFVVMHGFQRLFIESLEYGHRVLGKKTYGLLAEIDNSDSYLKLKKTIRFSDYSKKYLRDVKTRLEGEDGDLLTWVKNKESSTVEVRILTTRDDWVNSENAWPNSKAIMILPRGGHFGFRGGIWFDKLMNMFF